MNRIEKMIADLCPNGVEWKELGEVVEILDNLRKPISKENRISGKYPYYGANGIQDYVSDYLFEGEYILMGEDGSVIDKNNNPILHFVNGKIWVNNHAHILSKKTDNLRFIYYCLSITNVRKLVRGTPPKINQKSMSSIKIPIPPLEIQEEIVKILDKMTGYVTELQSELQSELQMRTKQYEHYREDLLTFEDHKVEWKSLGDLFEFKNGLNKEKQFFGRGNTIINYTDVYKNIKLFKDDLNGAVEVTDSEIDRFNVKKGDVFFTRTSETKEEIGKAAVLLSDLDNAVFSGFILRARPKTNLILPEYSAYVLSSNKIRDQIIRYSTYTTRALTNGTNLSKIIIPIPSLEIQERIVYVLDNFDKVCNDLNIGLPKEIELRQKEYEYYREKLLTFDSISDKHTHTHRYYNLLRLYQYVYGYVEVKVGDILEKKSGTKITAKQMKDLHKENAPVKIFAGGQTFALVNYEDIPRKDIHMESSIIVKSRGIVEFEYYEKPFSHKSEFWSYHSENGYVDTKYVYYYLKLHEQYFRNIASKMQMPQISSGDTQNFKILLPSISKQKQIVEILDKFDELVNSTKSGLYKEIELRQKQYEYWREKLLTF